MRFSLDKIYLYLTNYCNLRCAHCWICTKYKNKISHKDNIKDIKLYHIINALLQAKELGLKSVKITGGEPFLRRDIVELLEWLKNNKIKTSIETNGSLITKEIVKVLKNNKVSHISISLDGSDAETHEKIRKVKGSFSDTLEGINLIKSLYPDVSMEIIFTLYRSNSDKILDMCKFVEDIGIKKLKINTILQIGRAKSLSKNDLLSIKEILNIYKEVLQWESSSLKHKDFSIAFEIPPAFKPLKDMLYNKVGICNIKNTLGILSDGTVSICGIGQTVPELKLGNIVDHKIKEIWEDNKLLAKIRNDIPKKLEGICSICILKTFCLGRCRAEAYNVSGTLFAANSFCQQAYEQGLFPETKIFK